MTSAGSPEEHLDFSAPTTTGGAGPECGSCGRAIEDQYWSVGTAVICSACRTSLALEQGNAVRLDARGRRFAMALLLGIGGMIAGAAIWYGVAKFLDLEIGLIAILLGWLVGKGVMKGSGERGGRRYQVMAVLLTYLGIGLGYLPFVFAEVAKQEASVPPAISSDSTTAQVTELADPVPAGASNPTGARDTDVGFLEGMGALLVLVATLPLLVVKGAFPGSLISILIYGFAILQAWRMTASRELAISGPFRVAAAPAA